MYEEMKYGFSEQVAKYSHYPSALALTGGLKSG